MLSHYLMIQGQDVIEGQDRVFVPRIKGLTFLGDPNDLAQFLVGLMPCLFFFRKKSNPIVNTVMVYLPIAFLIYGVSLTRSRGGMLAMIAVIIFAQRRRIGMVPAIVVGGIFFVGLSAAGFTGGRQVNEGQGEDRISSWSVGIGLVRSHPLFGVGLNNYTDYYVVTAHNTVVVVGAELGLIGLFSWMTLS